MRATKKRLRILFICPADVSTAQSFVATVADTGSFDVLVFDSGRQGPFPAQKWPFPTISIYRSEHPANGWHRWIGLPSNRFVRFLIQKRHWISALKKKKVYTMQASPPLLPFYGDRDVAF